MSTSNTSPPPSPLSPQPDGVPAPIGPDVVPPVQPDATPTPGGPEITPPSVPEVAPVESPPEVSPGTTGLPEV
jgi:hypothetical protein